MHLNFIIELSMILDSDKFNKLFSRVSNEIENEEGNKYFDMSLSSKGIIVAYHDKQYKKRVRLTVNANVILDGETPDKDNASKLVRKLENRISDYFESKYELNDFTLNRMTLISDIDMREKNKVHAYIKVLQRIGRVKGFSPLKDDRIGDGIGFCLKGNSNGIEFMAYDKEAFLRGKLDKDQGDSERKRFRTIINDSEGLIRSEVRLTKPRAIRCCTEEYYTSEQIAVLSAKAEGIFLVIFQQIVPFGDFYKKAKAVEIIQKEVKDSLLRRRMIRLIELIPEKKSLLLAQKALNYRGIDKVMEMFDELNLSPVTVSKRHNVTSLKSLYSYL